MEKFDLIPAGNLNTFEETLFIKPSSGENCGAITICSQCQEKHFRMGIAYEE